MQRDCNHNSLCLSLHRTITSSLHHTIITSYHVITIFSFSCSANSKKTIHPHITIVHDEPEAKEYDKPDMLVSKKGGAIWYGLSVLDQLWPLLKKYEDQREHVRIVTANTAYGIQPVQPIIEQQKIMLFIGHIPQLTELACDGKTIVARCSVPIQQLRDLVQSLSTAHVEDQRSSYPPTIAYNHWKRLATTEIRNVGSIAGNLYLARRCDFPSDLHIVLTTLGATVVIRGPSDEGQEYGMIDFVQKKGILDGSNIIYEVKIPIEPRRNVFIRTYKVAKRPQNSHSLVNSGFSVEVEMTAFREVCIVFGNIGENFLRMTATEEWMQENCTPADLARQLPELLTKLEEELRRTVVPKVAASEEFRVDTARNIFFKFLVEMARVFELPNWTNLSQVTGIVCPYIVPLHYHYIIPLRHHYIVPLHHHYIITMCLIFQTGPTSHR